MGSDMLNKQGLMNLIARAENGSLLPGEAQILRDAVDLLDDMTRTLDRLMLGHKPGYNPIDTSEIRREDIQRMTDRNRP
jgi:hypothetical protein